MIETRHNSELLIEELQLGKQLNQCIHTDRRSDFALMLSMLTEDVLAHSQFSLPKTTPQIKETTNEQLRKVFSLPEERALALKELDEIDCLSQAELVANNQLATLHLENTLCPKPLAFRDDVKHIEQGVMANTTLYCQKKYEKQLNGSQTKKQLPFNVNEWLKAVQTTIVKAPLIEAYS